MNSIPLEITELISSFLPYIDDIIHLKSICKYLHTNLSLHPGTEESSLELCARIHKVNLEYEKLLVNQFSTRFITRNMDKKWNPYRLSRYPKLTDDIVRDNPHFPWIYSLVWKNPSISFEYAYELFEKCNDGRKKFFHPAITTDFILNTASSLLDWSKLTSHINVNFILEHRMLPWRILTNLSKNSTLTVAHITSHSLILNYDYTVNKDIIVHFVKTDPDKVSNHRLFIECVYIHRPELILTLSLTGRDLIKINKLALMKEEFFLKNINNKIWDFRIISGQINSKNFPIVLNNLNKNWDWRLISCRVNWNIIVNNPNCPWIQDIVSANRHITLQVVKNNPQYSWSFKGLSLNPNITFDYVREHKKNFLPYMKYVSINPGISLFAINKHPGYGWKWAYVSLRPSVTVTDTLKYKRIKWMMKYVTIDMKILRYRSLIDKELLDMTNTD